jgi:8-oxo-dGTP pyrophosphatase MutT (NUDIX family)
MMFEIDVDRILKLAGLLEEDNHSNHQNALNNTGFWGKAGAGCLFFATSTGRFLLNHRSNYVLEPGEYGVWGGAIDRGETPEGAVKREVREEAGYHGAYKLIPIFVFQKGNFRYSNFIAVVSEEFKPNLDWESQGFVWTSFDNWPSPLHFWS